MSILPTCLAATLLGLGLVSWERGSWPWPAALGAAFLLGPPAWSLLFFLAHLAGLPLDLTTALLCVMPALPLLWLRQRTQPRFCSPSGWCDLGPLLVALALFAMGMLRLLDVPTPDGDGLFNFVTKARAFHATGHIFSILKAPPLQVIHPDYPLHQPLLMNLGYNLGGGVGGLQALATAPLLMPGLVLFLGTLAARKNPLGGLLLALLLAGLPAFLDYTLGGYADPPLMALLAVAAVALLDCPRRLPTGVLAAGLMPWIKLEGGVLLALLLLVVLFRHKGWRKPLLAVALPALMLGSVWPLALSVHGLPLDLAEPLPGQTPGQAWHLLLRGFGRFFLEPESLLLLTPLGVLLAALLAAFQRSPLRPLGVLTLLILLAAPLLCFVRHTAPEHLSQGDVPARLLMQVLPLGLYVLVLEGTRRLRPASAPPAGSSSQPPVPPAQS